MKIANSPVNKTLYRLASVAVAALFSSQLAIAADITSELGANGQSDVSRIKGPLNLGVGCETRLWTDEKKPTCFDTCRLVVKAKR
jgi:hypothetical protein